MKAKTAMNRENMVTNANMYAKYEATRRVGQQQEEQRVVTGGRVRRRDGKRRRKREKEQNKRN